MNMLCTITGATDNEIQTPSAFKVPGHQAAVLPPTTARRLTGTSKPNLTRNVYSCANFLIVFYDLAFVVCFANDSVRPYFANGGTVC